MIAYVLLFWIRLFYLVNKTQMDNYFSEDYDVYLQLYYEVYIQQ